MKKLIGFFLITLLFILLITPAQALVTFGVKGGLNYSNLTFSPPADIFTNQKYLKSFSGGFFLAINLGPIGFQPEVLYSRRGFEFSGTDPISGPYQVQILLDYLEIPLLVRLNIIPLGPIKAYVFGGPSYGYLQKAKFKETSQNSPTTEDIKSDFKSSSLAAVGGLGLDLKIPMLFKITLDARYHYGLSNIIQPTSDLGTYKIKNKGFSIMLGLGF
ncbi:MAG: PorT family protein [Candidatus Aminicenantes bacterium]|nr:PorT family protein [Candidatus Aminicenantes bacterium]